jgi:hypothetical protein
MNKEFDFSNIFAQGENEGVRPNPSDGLLQVLVESNKLFEGSEMLVLVETNKDTSNLSSVIQQGIFTGMCGCHIFFPSKP